MFEHPSLTYNTIAVEQERVDRVNEMRRIISENPSRVVARRHRVLDRVRGWFGSRRADAQASAAPSGSPHVICDPTARPAHAR